jgi:hypothetical protein
MCGHVCTLTWRQFAATSVQTSSMSAVWLIMFTLSPRCLELFLAQMIEQIKKTSSKWIKALHARYRGFFWQIFSWGDVPG